jgi:hypothetical protein
MPPFLGTTACEQPKRQAGRTAVGTKSELKKLVEKFLSEVPSIQPVNFFEFDIRQVYPAHDSDKWRGAPGVYYFSCGEEIKYVGVGASRWGLGYRVYKGLNKIGLSNGYPAAPELGWSELLNAAESTVGMVEFEECDWFWPLSLEAFLVWSLRPPLNRHTFRPPLH